MVDMRTKEGRALREAGTRDAEARPEAWKPASYLPDPHPVDGMRFRWVRVSFGGQSDAKNVSNRFREGWVPVKKTEVPELDNIVTDFNSKFPDNVEVGGLLLCKISEEAAKQRQDYYEKLARDQIKASDANFMRQADPRMPLLKPERASRVTFGSGNPQK
jgi:hypothetical protein